MAALKMKGSITVEGVLVALDDNRVCLRLSRANVEPSPWYYATGNGWVAAGQKGSDELEAAWLAKQDRASEEV